MSSSDDEPRVGELLEEGDAQEIQDPALLARLAAWFSDPALQSGTRHEPPDTAHATRRKASERALDAVDAGLLSALEDHGARAGAILGPLTPVHLSVETDLARFDLDAWRLPDPGGPRELERPEDLRGAMSEQTPQAVLRDLYRPVRNYAAVFLRDRFLAPKGVDSADQVATPVMTTRYRVRMTELPNPRAMIGEDMADLRRRLRDEPWADVATDEPQKPLRYSDMDPDDLKWFGDWVGVDPDQ